MSQQRILRSSRKVLPDVVPVMSVETPSRKILFPTSGDLSNTPKESENEDEVPKKKQRKKTIRRTQNSFYIENETKTEAIEELLTKQSNNKTTKKGKKNPSHFAFKGSSDNDSVFEEGISSSKCLKSSINLRLPRVELDDFQTPTENKRKVKKEPYGNKGLKSVQRHKMVYIDSPSVSKKKEQDLIQVENEHLEKKRQTTSIKKNKKLQNVDDEDQIGGNKENFSKSPKKEKHISKSKKIEANENSVLCNLSEFTEQGKQKEVNKKKIKENSKIDIKLGTDRGSKTPDSVNGNTNFISSHDDNNFTFHITQSLRKNSRSKIDAENIFPCNTQEDFNNVNCSKKDETMENVEHFRRKNPTTENMNSSNSYDSDGPNIMKASETSGNTKNLSRKFSKLKDTSPSESISAEFETVYANFISEEKVQSDMIPEHKPSGSTENEIKVLQKSVSDINTSRSTKVNHTLSNYQNDCSLSSVDLCGDKNERIFNKPKSFSRLSRTSNFYVNEYGTSEESDFKNEQQEKTKWRKKRSRCSSRTAKKTANYSSEIKTSPKTPRFFNDGQKVLVPGGSKSINSNTNGDMQYISNQADSSSDSEIEFNCCPKNPLELVSDFSQTTGNIKVLSEKEDSDNTISTKKILVETKFDSNTDNERRPKMSMNVTTIKCEDNLIEIPMIKSETKQNKIGVSGRGRKRWTILEGTEARRSFQLQIDNLRKSLMTPKKVQDDKFLKPRRSNRKRWSDELRKFGSALDVSIGSKYNFIPETDNIVTDEVLVDLEVEDGLSRRSRSLTSLQSSPNGLEHSKKRSSITSPMMSETDKPFSSSELSNFEEQNSFEMANSSNNVKLSSYSLAPSNGKTRSRSLISSQSSPNGMEHSKKRNSITSPIMSETDTPFSSSKLSNFEEQNSFKMANSSNNVKLSFNSLAPSNGKTLSLADYLDSSVSSKTSNYRAGTSVCRTRSKSQVNATSDQSLEIEKESVKIQKIKNEGTGFSDNLDNLPLEPTSEGDGAIAVSGEHKLYTCNDDTLTQSETKHMNDTFGKEDTVNISLLESNHIMPSTSMRLSRSSVNTINDTSTEANNSKKATSHVRKPKVDYELINDVSYPSQKPTKKISFETNKCVNNIAMVRSTATRQSSNIRRSSSLADTLDSPPKKKSYRATPYVRKSKPDILTQDTPRNSRIQIKDKSSGTEYSMNDTDSISTSRLRRSTSLTDTLDNIQHKSSYISKSSLKLSTSPSKSTGLSRSSTNTLDRTSTETYKGKSNTPHVGKTSENMFIVDSSNRSQKSTRRTFDIEESVNDIALLRATVSRQSSNIRRSSSLADTLDSPPKKKYFKIYRATPYVRKSRLEGSIDDASNDSKVQVEGQIEMKNSMNDIDLTLSSCLRRSRSSTNTLDRTSTETCKSTTPHIGKTSENMFIVDSSNRSQKSTRRTFDIEESVNDIALLRATASRQSSNIRRSSSLADALDSPPKKKHFKGYRATPHVRKSRPEVSIDDTSNDSKLQNEGQIEMKNSLSDIDLTLSSSIRRSTSLTEATDIFPLKPSSNVCVRPSTSTGNLATRGSILKRRDTYELNESVTDINLLKSLSEGTLTDIGVNFLPDDSVSLNVSKRVRFENVTMRKVSKRTEKEPEAYEDQRAHNNKVTAATKKVSFKKAVGTKRSMSLDHTFFSPPSSSSTPKYTSQKPTSQKASTKDTLYGRRRSRSADEGISKIARIRMPNFAKIHERARDRMENIIQLTERRAERARLLLSGQKPTDSPSCLNSDTSENIVKKTHKQLNFDRSQPSTSKGFLRAVQDENSTKNIQIKNETKKLIGNSTKNKQIAGGRSIQISNEMKAGSSKTGFIKVAVPEKLKNAGRTLPSRTIGQNKVTQFGFKVKNDAGTETKAVQMKALATKSKLQQDNREERRTVLKGVRGNRRFELLMKMRKN